MGKVTAKYINSGLIILISFLFIPLYAVYAEDSIGSTEPDTSSTTISRDSTSSNTTIKRPIPVGRLEDNREHSDMSKDFFQTNFASREAELRKRLDSFRDQAKATVVARINKALALINQKVTKEMSAHLTRLSSMLDRLEKGVNNFGANGKDTTAAKAAILDARAKIDLAKAQVSSQSAKDYTITVTNEKNIGQDVKTKKDQLKTDLKSTNELVKVAREAVVNAINVAIKTLKGGSTGSSSATTDGS